MRNTLIVFFILAGFSAVSADPLEIAENYLEFEWTVRDSNVISHYTNTGDPHRGYTNLRPCDWVDSIGVIITGMPYHYGGKDTFAQWQDDYESNNFGPGAHSWHWQSVAPNSTTWAAGIDCSGLVSYCWGITDVGNCNCDTLAERATLISAEQVQPGDAFIRTAYYDHTRLCYARLEDALEYQWVDVIEATAAPYNKVIKRQLTIEEQMDEDFYCYSNSDSTNSASVRSTNSRRRKAFPNPRWVKGGKSV